MKHTISKTLNTEKKKRRTENETQNGDSFSGMIVKGPLKFQIACKLSMSSTTKQVICRDTFLIFSLFLFFFLESIKDQRK